MLPSLQGMGNILRVAQMFGEISAAAAEAANQARLEAAGRTRDLGLAQLDLEESTERRVIAQALQRHVGTLRVNKAYRGIVGRSAEATELQATMTAAQSASVISAEAAFKRQALIESTVVDLEDVGLARFRGLLEGFGVGAQIQSALNALAFEEQVPFRGGGDPRFGGSPLRGGQTIFRTPGLDFGRLLEGGELNFDDLFGGNF